MSRSVLEPVVIKHVQGCFTKRGMKENKVGRRQVQRVRVRRKEVAPVTQVDLPDRYEYGVKKYLIPKLLCYTPKRRNCIKVKEFTNI